MQEETGFHLIQDTKTGDNRPVRRVCNVLEAVGDGILSTLEVRSLVESRVEGVYAGSDFAILGAWHAVQIKHGIHLAGV